MVVKRLMRIGNSWAIVIPPDYLRAIKTEAGGYVSLRLDHEGHIVVANLEEYIHARNKARPREA